MNSSASFQSEGSMELEFTLFFSLVIQGNCSTVQLQLLSDIDLRIIHRTTYLVFLVFIDLAHDPVLLLLLFNKMSYGAAKVQEYASG